MKQRNKRLALLCITTALLAAGKTTKAEAHETNQQVLGQTIDDVHTGVATVAIDAALDAAEQEVERLQTAAEAEELPLEETKELAVAQVDSYINVRNLPSLEGEIIGKLHNNSVGEIIEEAGDWLKITSGSVEGYIKAEYVLRGEEGAAKAEEVGERLAKVEAVTLRLREEATTESETLHLLPQEEVLPVQEETDGWVKVTAGETEGYVSADYVEVYTVYQEAESKEEEERRLAEEAARAAEEAAARAEQERQNVSRVESHSSSPAASAPANRVAQEKLAEGQTEAQKPQASTGLGQRIADFALQFVGNPYVYGGTSLTNGADCSGFVMSVFQNFGISLPRTSGEQGQCGTNVGGIGNAVPGDLVSYSGHIGIYIGNGQIVHASSAKTGIKVSNASYRPILSVRRIV